jgi:hypothetical protein
MIPDFVPGSGSIGTTRKRPPATHTLNVAQESCTPSTEFIVTHLLSAHCNKHAKPQDEIVQA